MCRNWSFFDFPNNLSVVGMVVSSNEQLGEDGKPHFWFRSKWKTKPKWFRETETEIKAQIIVFHSMHLYRDADIEQTIKEFFRILSARLVKLKLKMISEVLTNVIFC